MKISIIFFIGVLLLLHPSISLAKGNISVDGYQVIAAAKLYDKFESNQIACEEKYNGKTIIITGIIQEISKTIFGGSPFLDIGDVIFFKSKTIPCYFSEKDKSIISKLHKGQFVKIKGVVGGLFGNGICINNSVLQ